MSSRGHRGALIGIAAHSALSTSDTGAIIFVPRAAVSFESPAQMASNRPLAPAPRTAGGFCSRAASKHQDTRDVYPVVVRILFLDGTVMTEMAARLDVSVAQSGGWAGTQLLRAWETSRCAGGSSGEPENRKRRHRSGYADQCRRAAKPHAPERRNDRNAADGRLQPECRDHRSRLARPDSPGNTRPAHDHWPSARRPCADRRLCAPLRWLFVVDSGRHRSARRDGNLVELPR